MDRPPLNAITQLMVVEAYETLTVLSNDTSVRIIILTGAGKAFCPGADIGRMASGAKDADLEAYHYRVAALLHDMPQVTVAAINGACAGAGLSCAAACDIRVAADVAMFRTAFLDVGVAGDMGGPWTLSRALGSARARDLYLMSEKFDASEAQRLGLVTRVFPSVEFEEEVGALVERLAARDPAALLTTKANFVAAERMTLSDYIDLETERHHRLIDRPETRAAFAGRRPGTIPMEG